MQMQTPDGKALTRYVASLPVGAIADAVNASLQQLPRIVVTAPPGSGKSTLLPLTLLGDTPHGRIVMLEPRRAAARQIALRMAQMLGEKPGATVGYRMRFESKISAETRIEVVTEGVMERMLVDDPTLDGVSAVIFDEFHERSLAADLCLALTREAQSVIRPDLRIVIMSATMDTDVLCKALDAPLIEADGKLHNVTVCYGEDIDVRDCARAVATAVRRAYREQTGNILAFLPGQAEIAACAALLADSLHDALVLPLHGMLPASEQYKAIEYNPAGRRKILLATPLAETSLTIEGVCTVVDSGLYKGVVTDSLTGLAHLETRRISLDMATQRTGRAGRLSDGVCYRLWSKATEHRMAPTRLPEIVQADLGPMVLQIAAWGSATPAGLPWLTAPPPGHIADAVRMLAMLGAIDEAGRITPHGKKMAALPCHPRIANMLLNATDDRQRALAADIAAILEEKAPVNEDNDADISTRISLLRRQRRHGEHGRWSRITQIAAQYRRMAGCPEDNSDPDARTPGILIASAYPERIAMKLKDGIYRLPGGENVALSETDNLSGCTFLAVASMGRRIYLASPLDQDVAERIARPYTNLSWNSREGRIVARTEMRIGVLVVTMRPLDNPDHNLIVQTVCEAAVKEGRSMFDFNDNVTQLQQRIATVAQWHPELRLPDVTVSTMLATAPQWLPLYIGQATRLQELRKIDICHVIEGLVGYDTMEQINRIAPTHIKLPCGRTAKIDYRSGATAPVVSARLQDCLGLYDTPRLDDGRRPVLMELLSPGFKPVQLTQDMRGFWTGTYFEVRKELRRRYPKHRWPDDPFNL